MRLIVADSDVHYARMLARAIRESDWRRKVTVVLAAGDGGAPWPETGSGEDAVLADAAWCERLLKRGSAGTLICLGEERGTEEVEMEGRVIPCLFKYQSVHDLMAQLMQHLRKQPAGEASPGTSACRFVAVGSASGGAGKTTFATGLAEWLAMAGHRTCYLNLERIPSFPGGGPDGTRRFARVLYHMRRGERDRLLSLATRHPDRGYDAFPAADHAGEWEEYEAADVRELVRLLVSSGRWDMVVADCESALTPLTRTALHLADDVFWLETEDEIGTCKSAFARRMLAGAGGAPEGGAAGRSGGEAGGKTWHTVPVRSAGRREPPDFRLALRQLGIEGGEGDA